MKYSIFYAVLGCIESERKSNRFQFLEAMLHFWQCKENEKKIRWEWSQNLHVIVKNKHDPTHIMVNKWLEEHGLSVKVLMNERTLERPQIYQLSEQERGWNVTWRWWQEILWTRKQLCKKWVERRKWKHGKNCTSPNTYNILELTIGENPNWL